MPGNLRIDWFEHVRKTRKKLAKERKEGCTHRDAMRAASITWTNVREKLLKKRKRQEAKDQRDAKSLKKSHKDLKTLKKQKE